MAWIKGGFEVAGLTGGLYIFYRGFMGVSYEVINWVLTRLGYPE